MATELPPAQQSLPGRWSFGSYPAGVGGVFWPAQYSPQRTMHLFATRSGIFQGAGTTGHDVPSSPT